MTTEREYQQWQKRQNKVPNKNQYSAKKKKKNYSLIYLIILISSLGFAVKNYPQTLSYLTENINLTKLSNLLQNFSLQDTSLKYLTEEYVIEISEPVLPNESVIISPEKDFSLIDKRAKSIQYSGNSVEELSQLLSYYAVTEVEKARIIYTWITHNIRYDVEALNRFHLLNIYPDVNVETVLTSRQTICSGYANLYQKLAEKMGLESVIIIGYADGGESYAVSEDDQANHAWNAVKIDNNWFLIDSTWGAGTINNNVFKPEFNPYYFATPPQQFIYTHFPENPQWQLLNNPLSRQEFDNLPQITPKFFQYNIELIGEQNKTIFAQDRVSLTFRVPRDVVAIAKLQSEEKGTKINYTFVQKQGEKLTVNASFPEKGNYQLDIFAKPKDGNNYYPLVASYQIIAEGEGKKFPTTYQHFTDYNGYLESPLLDNFNPNQNVYFKLKIDSATEVKVVDSQNKWHDLTRYGNVFAGNVNVGEGKVMVYAKFPQDSRYWALLKYGN